MKGKEAQKRKS